MPSVRSRAATSCSRCRSRKQKCDARKPTCSRCQTINEPCVWPATHKRGPAKGYTEALEHRLAETENVLLQLLSVTDSEVISQAFSEGRALPRRLWAFDGAALSPSAAPNAEPNLPGPNKAGLMAHWDRFPLNTADSLRCWAEKSMKDHAKATMNCVAGRHILDSLDQREQHSPDTHQQSLLSENCEPGQDDSSDNVRRMPLVTFDLPTSPCESLSHHGNATEAGLGQESTSSPKNQLSAAGQNLSSAPRSGSVTYSRDKQKVDLSWDFRQQFLW